MTYRDGDLPSDEALNKDVLQRFFKRFRKELSPRKIRYFSCGEYGEDYGRAHYHAIVFGEDDSTINWTYQGREKNGAVYGLLPSWPHGHVYIGGVTYDSARYVADYLHKETRSELLGGREPPFALKSNGIGKQYCLDNKERLTRNMMDTIRGTPVGLPLAYRRWLNIDKAAWWERGAEQEKELWKHYIEKHGQDPVRIHAAMAQHRAQHDRNLRAVQSLVPKGSE